MPTTERVVPFGPRGRGVGILSAGSQQSDVGLLILNAGLLHRVGHSRIGVRLARRAAGVGFPAYRIDFSGIGDSEGRPDGRVDLDASRDDLVAALEKFREVTGVQRVVSYGLCRGADVALYSSPHVPELVGISMVDPWCFPTPKYWVSRYGPSVLSLDVWKRAPKTLTRMLGRGAVGDAEDAEPERQMVEQETVTGLLSDAVARRCQLLAFCTGGYQDSYAYHGQFRDAYGSVEFADLLTERYVPESDHLVTRPEHQEMLLDDVLAMLNRVARPAR